MITNEILQNVFHIKYGNSIATCFAVSIDNYDHLVTAKHLFLDVLDNTLIDVEIYCNKKWDTYHVVFLKHTNEEIDIAVLRLNSSKFKKDLFDIGSEGAYLSQDCYFLGFPLGRFFMEDVSNLNNGFPIPMVKKAIIASFMHSNPSRILLDGHNNPGFSGGPVIVSSVGTDNKKRWRIIAVISGYIIDLKVIKYPDGDLTHNENSGIIDSYDAGYVYEIIRRK